MEKLEFGRGKKVLACGEITVEDSPARARGRVGVLGDSSTSTNFDYYNIVQFSWTLEYFLLYDPEYSGESRPINSAFDARIFLSFEH